MLAAALLVGVFMLTLGWAAEIVGILFSGKTVCWLGFLGNICDCVLTRRIRPKN